MRRHRAAFAVVLLACAGALGYSYATSPADAAVATYEREATLPADQRSAVVPPRDDVTVIAGHGVKGETAALVAFGPDGRLVYYNDSYAGYFDVDPSDAGRRTVEYVAERSYDSPHCKGPCTLSVVERVNLTTGEVTRIHSEVFPQDRGANWHDVDRVGASELLVGDIYRDEVSVVNTTTGLTTWEWSATEAFPLSGGGEYPTDWAHLNDVERLPDGRYMVSLRNQDQVVFVDPETGIQPGWTLGAENDYETLYEQHNPDYIPESRGGPAVVVADSLNDRVVEYERVDGKWEQSWVWSDDGMQWPRDADRLPNGHTLIADTNAHRVIEIDEDGEVVWSVDVYAPYDVERLDTGDESAGGPAAATAGLDSRTPDDPPPTTVVAGLTPRKVTNSVTFVLPVWMGLADAVVAVVMVVTALVWAGVEYRRSSVSVSLQWPVRFSR